ncbi:MAG: hypothetical protein NVS4B11_26050 [Ktedonobacteraceae bacterium]
MIFCGQCGLQLPSGMARCPRCGTVADTTSDVGIEAFPADTPTAESLTYALRPQATVYPDVPHPSIPFTPPGQQKLVLRAGSGGGYDYDLLGENEPTSALNVADYRTQQKTPVNFQTGTSHTGYPDNAGYPAQASTVYQNGGYTAPNYTYAGNIPPGGAVPPSYPLMPPKKQGKGRAVPLLLALFGLLLVVGVATFLLVERSHLFGNPGSTNNGTTQNASSTPTDQAKGVVRQYYADVNSKNYQEAYSLWKWGANGPSLAAFEQGYANTAHDALTIRNATLLGNGTVRVALSLVATEHIDGKTVHHTYAGYYIVGQDGGTWKILRGVLNRVR